MTSSRQEYGYDGNGGGRASNWLQQTDSLPQTSRRRKFAGYLKAANELRMTYQDTAVQTWKDRNNSYEYGDGDPEGLPGAFPDAAVVRSGDDQMIIFPSYARKHIKRKPKVQPGTIQETPGAGRDVRDTAGEGDAEYWREQWRRYEEDHNVVDVDVRGWIYSPHKGQMSRKQRLFISVARQLAGLPNPNQQGSSSPSNTTSRSSSPHPHASPKDRLEARSARHDEERVAKEAENILRTGQAEADAAARGDYSEQPGRDSDSESVTSSRSRPSVSSEKRVPGMERSPLKQVTSVDGQRDDERPIKPVQKRASWNQPTQMTSTELAMANASLMTRLRPFLATPLANTAISAFFYNNDHSELKTIYTDNNGHFTIRAALEFVPTHVRILASEDLSDTVEVIVTESKGVSLISDIDDTLKHSGIGSGARAIFQNAFIRDLKDLTVDGVNEWYNRLAKMGVKFHYVSNSPWQLYPALTKFFSLAGLPPGSFHLKQYSGMLQGIFEPVAERKKSTLDKLARDFPERSFILVGDSGEADLEVYTDFVLENPGRVLGVFIRDVTTTPSNAFFSSSNPSSANVSPGGTPRRSPRMTPNVSPKLGPARDYSERSSAKRNIAPPPTSYSGDENDDPELQAAIRASMKDFKDQENRDQSERRPQLPARRTDPPAVEVHSIDLPEEDLIDFSDDDQTPGKPYNPLKPVKSFPSTTSPQVARKPANLSSGKSPPPMPPKKPVALHGGATQSPSSSPAQTNGTGKSKPRPPKPRRPSTTVRTPSPQPDNDPVTPGSTRQTQTQTSYTGAVGQKLSSAYNALPPIRPHLPGGGPTRGYTSSAAGKPPAPSPRPKSYLDSKGAPPPPPPRRGITSYPAAAANYASNRLSGLYYGNEPSSNSASQTQPYSTGDSLSRTSSNTSSISTTRPSAANREGSYRSEYWEQQPQLSQKEKMWRQRWAQASQVMREQGVVLRSWRVGTDVEKEAVKLVEEALQREREGKGVVGKSKWRGSSLEQ